MDSFIPLKTWCKVMQSKIKCSNLKEAEKKLIERHQGTVKVTGPKSLSEWRISCSLLKKSYRGKVLSELYLKHVQYNLRRGFTFL